MNHTEAIREIIKVAPGSEVLQLLFNPHKNLKMTTVLIIAGTALFAVFFLTVKYFEKI